MQRGQHVGGGSHTSPVAQLWCNYLSAIHLLFKKRRQMTPSSGIWGNLSVTGLGTHGGLSPPQHLLQDQN